MTVWHQHGAVLNERNFVQLAAEQVPWDTVNMILYIDDNSQSLRDARKAMASRRVGEANGQAALARLGALLAAVATNVAAALKCLHAANLAFFDLHPGQIVVGLRNDQPVSVRLVDVEAIQPFEAEAQPHRRVWRVPSFEPRDMKHRRVSAETDAESLALTLEWLTVGDSAQAVSKTSRILSVNAQLFNSLELMHNGTQITREYLTKLKIVSS